MNVLVLYGSETGNCESIAKEVYESILALNNPKLNVKHGTLNEYKKLGMLEDKGNNMALIVTSTTGNGESPGNADRFFRFVKRRSQPKDLFADLRYSVLAMGDTNYDKFCYVGTTIDKRLNELGAFRQAPISCCDEATDDLVEAVTKWKEYVLDLVTSAAEQTVSKSDTVEADVSTNQVEVEVIEANNVSQPEESGLAPSPSTMTEKAEVVVTETKADIAVSRERSPERSQLTSVAAANEILFLYGSETGNAESISKEVYEIAISTGWSCKWTHLDDYKKTGILEKSARICVFVASTTGNGDAPNNASRFMRYLRKRSHPSDLFDHILFAVLALGDTNYDKFCHVGKTLHSRMQALGATSVSPLVCADEGTGLADTVEPWKLQIIEKLQELLPSVEVVQEQVAASPQKLSIPKEPKVKHVPTSTKKDAEDRIGWSPPETVLSYTQLYHSYSKESIETRVAAARCPRVSPCLVRVTFVETADISLDRNRPRSESLADYGRSPLLPLTASVVSATYLTSNVSAKRTVAATLCISRDETMLPEWQPGDAVGIVCPNPALLVEGVIRKLGFSRDKVIRVDKLTPGKPIRAQMFPQLGVNTIWEILTWGVDLSTPPRKQFLRVLAEYCADDNDRLWLTLLSSTAGKDEFKALIESQEPSFLELLNMFPSCDPPLEVLLYNLPTLSPRLYSISNSPLTDHGYRRLRIAFTVVRREVPLHASHSGRRIISGICTSWLESVCEPWLLESRSLVQSPVQRSFLPSSKSKEVRVFIKPSSGFRLPAQDSTPAIMVGPGTGVAPFLGFLEHRKLRASKGEARHMEMFDGYWRGGLNPIEGEVIESTTDDQEAAGPIVLYFGCRHPKHDLLFMEEIQDYVESKVLSRFDCSFSRYKEEDRNARYVYQSLRRNSREVYDLLVKDSGSFFVCGSLKMATSVHEALVDVLQQRGAMNEEEAILFLKDMVKRGRYLKDVWG